MLHLLDESLKSFLVARVPLRPDEVEISFEAPDRDWAARVSQPTLDLYLWEVRPNLDQAELGYIDVPLPEGGIRRQAPRPRLDCRYLLTVWTRDVADEHALLGRVLLAVLTHPILPPQNLAGSLTDLTPLPNLTLSPGGSTSGSDFWSALGGQLKPALDLVVTLTVDAQSWRAAGPPVESVYLRHTDTNYRHQDGREVRLHPSESAPPA